MSLGGNTRNRPNYAGEKALTGLVDALGVPARGGGKQAGQVGRLAKIGFFPAER